MSRQTILVTGAAGFIGSNLCRRLLKLGHRVIGLDDLSVGFLENIQDFKLYDDDWMFLHNDVRECKYLTTLLAGRGITSVDTVFHFAARGETYWCEKHPQVAVDINVNGTISAIEFAKVMGCKLFVFTDTSAEYDNIPTINIGGIQNYPSNEFDELLMGGKYLPKGYYSITKMAASQFVRAMLPDMNYAIIRPFNVYGPSMNLVRDIPPVVGAFTKAIIKSGTCKIYGDGSKRRDFIYIDDVVNLFTKILDHKEGIQSTYNMGYGENYSIYEIFSIVSDVCAELGYNEAKLKFEANKDYEAEITLADISHTRRTFDWVPKVDIYEGIKRTVAKLERQLKDE